MADTRLSIRIDLGTGDRIGPGKIALLEAIRTTGSISAAARSLKMSYRRAWLLVEELNSALREPAVTAETGGRHGGGAVITPAGERVVGLIEQLNCMPAWPPRMSSAPSARWCAENETHAVRAP